MDFDFETVSSLLETLMLICFGFSWPLNLIKSYKARTAKSTSLPFILLIITGYIAGIAAKIITAANGKEIKVYVLAAYFLNLIIVSLNLFVYFRNLAFDKKLSLAKNKD